MYEGATVGGGAGFSSRDKIGRSAVCPARSDLCCENVRLECNCVWDFLVVFVLIK